MQLSNQSRTSDWYLYQNHTNIRSYGCELSPYKLPKYLPMRIFSLEYFRQIISSDEIHFIAYKKKTQFKVKTKSAHSFATTERLDQMLIGYFKK